MTTREHIRNWLKEAKEAGATHVVIRSDDFSKDWDAQLDTPRCWNI